VTTDPTFESLHSLLAARRDDVITAWSAETARLIASASLAHAELLDRMPDFVDQVIAALHPEAIPLPPTGEVAEEHGAQRLRIGFDVGEVVREYGLLHRSILEAAARSAYLPTLREQQVIARWLSTGIADAVAQYVKQRDIERQRQTSEHLGFIAHELRNPLATARLAFARMQQAAPEAFANARWADALERNLRRTMELINNVLGQASLQLGVEPAIERVDLRSFLEELVADAEAESQSRNITVTLSAREGIPLEVDPRLMRSAISNLLDNALKFSHPDSYIDLIVTQPAGRVLIDVIDSCGGLPPGKAEELFKPLVQRSENRSGYGLGLAIALQAAEAHHGTIRVRDRPGVGCVFTIDLPATSRS
jgi:signal transduction histidine kinase